MVDRRKRGVPMQVVQRTSARIYARRTFSEGAKESKTESDVESEWDQPNGTKKGSNRSNVELDEDSDSQSEDSQENEEEEEDVEGENNHLSSRETRLQTRRLNEIKRENESNSKNIRRRRELRSLKGQDCRAIDQGWGRQASPSEDTHGRVLRSRTTPRNTRSATRHSDSESEAEQELEDQPRYHFRTRKPRQPFNASGSPKRAGNSNIRNSYSNLLNGKRQRGPKRRRFKRRRHFDSSSESNSSTSCFSGFSGKSGWDEEKNFVRYQRRTHERELGAIQPIAGTGSTAIPAGGSRVSKRDALRADAAPIVVDPNITWESIGGLNKHVRMLKEMVQLPLVYPEVFQRFGAEPPRGILFHGPPGTGKTLTARALANACSNSSGQRVAFFMRKGADCLSKWVGEAERQLRLLFEQAKKNGPSIIFFDEIDGLAPVRSARQDQIHTSIVSTLLALMDGLDSRGHVIVIGATNRPDSVDPALRRPGRFDRELAFSLPNKQSRQAILNIHTKPWTPPPNEKLVEEIAKRTVGYCGADLKSLCVEATIRALRRRYPQIYENEAKLVVDPSEVKPGRRDFAAAMKEITPASQRCAAPLGAPLPRHLSPILSHAVTATITLAKSCMPQLTIDDDLCPHCDDDSASSDDDDDDDGIWHHGSNDNYGEELNGIVKNIKGKIGSAWLKVDSLHKPRILIVGSPGQGQIHVAAAALHVLEALPCFSLDLSSLVSDPSLTPEAALVAKITEARRSAPSILYLPGVERWWGEETSSQPLLRSTLISLLSTIPDSMPILVLGSVYNAEKLSSMPDSIKQVLLGYSNYNTDGVTYSDHPCVVELTNPCGDSLVEYLDGIVEDVATAMKSVVLQMRVGSTKKGPLKRKRDEILEVVPLIPPREPDPDEVTPESIEQEDHYLREIRHFFRLCLYELRKERRYGAFLQPVSTVDIPDYLDIIKKPMDLETMHNNVDAGVYETLESFMSHLNLIHNNAIEYNPCDERDSRGKLIIHAAAAMKDAVLSMAHIFTKKLGYNLFKRCTEVVERRRKREKSSKSNLRRRDSLLKSPEKPNGVFAKEHNGITEKDSHANNSPVKSNSEEHEDDSCEEVDMKSSQSEVSTEIKSDEEQSILDTEMDRKKWTEKESEAIDKMLRSGLPALMNALCTRFNTKEESTTVEELSDLRSALIREAFILRTGDGTVNSVILEAINALLQKLQFVSQDSTSPSSSSNDGSAQEVDSSCCSDEGSLDDLSEDSAKEPPKKVMRPEPISMYGQR